MNSNDTCHSNLAVYDTFQKKFASSYIHNFNQNEDWHGRILTKPL